MPELSDKAEPTPATPIGAMGDWRLEIQCGRCLNHAILPVPYLVLRYGEALRIGDVIRRLRCCKVGRRGKCGSKPSELVLVEGFRHGKSFHEKRAIPVRL